MVAAIILLMVNSQCFFCRVLVTLADFHHGAGSSRVPWCRDSEPEVKCKLSGSVDGWIGQRKQHSGTCALSGLISVEIVGIHTVSYISADLKGLVGFDKDLIIGRIFVDYIYHG